MRRGRRSSSSRASSTSPSRRISPRPRRSSAASVERARAARRSPGCTRSARRAAVHRDPRRALDARRHRAARDARRSRRSLPGLEHEARRAASRRSPRCSARGVNVALGTDGAASNNRARPVRRDAHRRSARKGRHRRRVGAGPAQPGAERRRRSPARARSDSSAQIGSLVRASRRIIVAVDLSALERRALLRSRLPPRPRGGPRRGHRRLGRRPAHRRGSRAPRLPTKRRSAPRARAWQERLNERQWCARPRCCPSSPVAAENVDASELAKFAALAHQWWDPESAMFGPLHKMNPLRLDWIERMADGLSRQARRRRRLRRRHPDRSDGRARRRALGIDLGDKALGVARLHKLESGTTVDYRRVSAEALAVEAARRVRRGRPAWSCSSTSPNPRRSSPRARSSAKPGGLVVVLDDQPQRQVVRARGHRRRVRAADSCRRARTITPNS